MTISDFEIVKVNDGINETMHIVGCRRWPLEAHTIENLRGIVVGGLYPLML